MAVALTEAILAAVIIASSDRSGRPWLAATISGFVLGNLALVCFSALVLAYPDGFLVRRDRAIVVVGALVAIGGNLLVALFDETPASGCAECPESAIAVFDSGTVTTVVTNAGSAAVGDAHRRRGVERSRPCTRRARLPSCSSRSRSQASRS